MKQYIWSIKVSDLLRTIWSTDTIVFEHKFVHNLDTVIEPGISGDIFLQTLNSTSIQVTVNLHCTVTDISDISWNEYTRDVIVENYETLYSLPQEEWVLDKIYDSYPDIYEIDPHHLLIDMEDCIINAIKSQEPIVKIKNDETLWEWWIEVVDLPPL